MEIAPLRLARTTLLVAGVGLVLAANSVQRSAGSVPPTAISVPPTANSGPQESSSDAGDDASSRRGRAVLAAMVEALGGEQWLGLKNEYREGRISGFYHGNPTGAIMDFYDWREPLGNERTELTKKHDVVELYVGQECIEVTYKGRHAQPKEDCADYLRRRDHSIDVAVRVWLKDPRTIVEYDGKQLAERHLADQVTLISADNDAITIQTDAATHLPLQRSFQWRDPLYHDKNTEVEEYDDYHTIEGIPTPFTITRLHNGDMTQQRFLYHAGYNVRLTPDTFDVEATVKRRQR
jgi:hypothetical protein